MPNTQPDVFVFDDLKPEDNAMVQSLYSRDPASVLDHRKKVEEVGSGSFMDRFYIGYGHGSIGEGGSTTIFEENVSMPFAKAMQDCGLYRGQEASTRYLDFSKQPQYDPYDHPASKAILERWLELYNFYMPKAVEGLRNLHPFNPETDGNEARWEKAIVVRAFDTLRSLLPVGTTTNLSWHTDLRTAREHLRHMSHHPSKEVRDVTLTTYEMLRQKYPNSFNGEEMDPDSERYRERNEYANENAFVDHYLSPEDFMRGLTEDEQNDILCGGVRVENHLHPTVRDDVALLNRPRGAPLARRLMKYGLFNVKFLLDFGSFRDLARHRNGFCPVPLVTNEFGFFQGYSQELERILSPEDYATLEAAIEKQLFEIETLCFVEGMPPTDAIDNQYLYPMGMAVGCELAYSLPQMVYVSELRSAKTVHFTLRPVAQDLGRAVNEAVPTLNTYVDNDVDSFTAKRGDQDIVQKPVS